MMSGGATVDVLVLYTPPARADNGGTTATVNWINTMFADYNNILSEVGLSTYSFNVKAALETKWPTFPSIYHENSTHNGTNACVPNTRSCDSLVADQYWVSTNATASSLRDTHHADLVVLITADSQKHSSDFLHGFAGLKLYTHGGYCSGRTCGEFVAVRDIYALANKTLHHEIGHAMGMIHRLPDQGPSDGARTFGFTSNGSEPPYSNHKKPFTIMEVNSSPGSPICLWSANSTSSTCEVRLPFFADDAQYRTMYYGWPTPRKFDPDHHVEGLISVGMN